MNLKQILFGGLLLAVPFTACTNEELLEMNAPATNLEEAVALGEGYTIAGTKGVESRFVISESDGKFSAVWEETDMVGGAWIGYQTTAQKATGAYTDLGKVMSNHPFAFSKDLGGMKTVEFKAPTNVFEGKHILYYPYDATFKAVQDYIPVKIEQNQTMDCTAGKELDHINANSFAWTTIDAKGGPVAGKFALNQVTNIVSLKLGAEKKISDRFVGKKIEKIIIEAVNEDGDGMLYNEARLKGNSPSDGKYANFKGEMTYPSAINTYILTVENATADYEATEAGEDGITAKPFYLAMLKANDDIEAITVRAIMSDGRVFYKTIEIDDNEDLFEELIQAEGTDQLVEMEVVFDSEDKAGTIYTADQFKDALSSVKNGETITLGADITLETLTLDYDYTFTIEGSKLVVKNEMEVTAGNVTFEDGVLVAKGANIYVGEDAVLNAGEVLEVGSIEVDGAAELSASVIKSAAVNKAGKLTIDNTGYVIGTQIYANVAALKVGRSSDVQLRYVVLSGKTNVADGEVNFTEVTNRGVLTAQGDLTGTILNTGTLNMEEVDGNLTINNQGKVVVTGEDWEFNGVINNNAATSAPTYYSAGTMEVSMDEEATFSFSKINMNKGTTLDLKVGAMEETTQDALVLGTGVDNYGTLNIAEESVFVLADDNASTNGFINIENDENIDESNATNPFATNVKVAATVKKANKLNDILDLTDINTIVINDALTIPTAPASGTNYLVKMQNLNWIVKKNITLSCDVALNADFESVGNVQIKNSKTDGTINYTLTLNQTKSNVINGGTLTVGNYITLDGSAADTSISLKSNGSIAKGTINANITGNVKVAL